MFLILVAVGIIAGSAKFRLDFTADKIYTLSEGTKKILGQLDTPVKIHFYCTQSDAEMPVPLKAYAKRVEDLLTEYRQISKGRVQIVKFDPQPDSDAEESARIDGVEGQVMGRGGIIGMGDKAYLGLAVICVDQKTALPFLDPNREKLLEYDLTRAIAQAVNPKKQNLGVMSGLQVFGQFNPMMARMGGGGGTDPWIVISELKRDFNVKQIEMTAEKIDDDINVLLVIHPSNISEAAQYAIDQFVLRGGRLMALLDPMSVVDSRNAMNMQNMMQRAAANGSSLDRLLRAWGLEFDVNKVLADKNYVTMVRRGEGQAGPEPTWLSLTAEAIHQNDVITSQIDTVLLAGAGVFTGTPVDGLKQDVLLKSSVNSHLVDKMMAQFGGDTGKDYVASGKEYSLAVRLSGRFKTAFPDGKPSSPTENKDEPDQNESKAEGDTLTESQTDGVVILIGDSDFAFDQFSVQIQNFFGQRLASPFNGNLGLVQNSVEQLMGDSNLIAVRSRAVQNRPFTLVKKIQAQAEEQYQSKIKQFETDLQQTQQKLAELQQGKDTSQRFILSPEQQEQIKKLQATELDTKRELKEVRKQLRKDIDSLETRLKWINIAGMPFLVTVAGISLAFFKRKKTAAK